MSSLCFSRRGRFLSPGHWWPRRPVGRHYAPRSPLLLAIICIASCGGESASVIAELPALLVLDPSQATLFPGEAQQFQVRAESRGIRLNVAVQYSATGGSVTPGGAYTAGAEPGSFHLTASDPTRGLADTAFITILPPPSLQRILISPNPVELGPLESRQLNVLGLMTSGDTVPVDVDFRARAGTVTPDGLYTSPRTASFTPEEDLVIATELETGLADTARILVDPGYSVLIGEDWSDVATERDLSDKSWFFQYAAGTDPVECGDAVPVTDETFGTVVRIRLNPDDGPGCQRTVFAWKRIEERESVDRRAVWFRFKIRFDPGWTTYHSDTINAASYKLSHISLEGGPQLRIQYDWDALHCPTPWGEPDAFETSSGEWWNLGYRRGEWSDGEWYEFVQYVDVRADPAVRAGWWKRRLTLGGDLDPGPWSYLVQGFDAAEGVLPVDGVGIGQNFNRPLDQPQYHYIGPVEVVDGSSYPDPYGLAGDLLR